MLTVYVCEDCGHGFDREGSPNATCPLCGGGGRVVADDNGEYCFDCGQTQELCTCIPGSQDGFVDEDEGDLML